MSQLVKIILLLVVLTALTAAAPTGMAKCLKQTTTAHTIKLIVPDGILTEYVPFFKQLTKEFEKAYPGYIPIRFEPKYRNSNVIDIVNQEQENYILIASMTNTLELEQTRKIAAVTDLLPPISFSRQDLDRYSYGADNQTQFGVPLFVSTSMVYYNQNMLKNNLDNEIQSWNSFQNMLQGYQNGQDNSNRALFYVASYSRLFEDMIGQLGGSMSNGNLNHVIVQSDPAQKALSLIQGMAKTNIIGNKSNAIKALNMFQNGDCPVVSLSSGALGTLSQKAQNFPWNIAMMPGVRESNTTLDVLNLYLSNNLTVEERQSVQMFIQFMYEASTQQQVFAQTGYIPVVKQAIAQPSQYSPAHQVILQQFQHHTNLRMVSYNYSEVDELIEEGVKSIINDPNIDNAKVLKETQQQVDDTLIAGHR